MKLALRLLTVLIVGAGALVATGSPASAAPPCWIVNPSAPALQSNSVFWAAEVDCAGYYNIHIRTNLYKIVGSGDNQSYVWVDFSESTQFRTWLYLPWSRGCNGSGWTTYIFNIYAYANGATIPPYPKWSSVSSVPCGA